MGVDCKIKLPDNVRIEDVAHVIGIAAGLKPIWSGDDTKWIEVPGVNIKHTSVCQMAEINIVGPLVDGEEKHFVYYHFESDYGGRSLGPRSTAFWLAVAKRLVDFFGGKIDYQDCDDTDVDYAKPANSNDINCPSDGDEWDAFQQRKFEVKPITKEELVYLDGVAAYKMSEGRRGE